MRMQRTLNDQVLKSRDISAIYRFSLSATVEDGAAVSLAVRTVLRGGGLRPSLESRDEEFMFKRLRHLIFGHTLRPIASADLVQVTADPSRVQIAPLPADSDETPSSWSQTWATRT